MTESLPWTSLPEPADGKVAARRVAAEHPRDFFWARDAIGRPHLILEFPQRYQVRRQLPKLKGIEFRQSLARGERARVAIVLTDLASSELFLKLCLDIVAHLKKLPAVEEAERRFIDRALSWHRLLKDGGSGRLNLRAQMGLLGELAVLEGILIPSVGLEVALASWVGPIGAPKDFAVGPILIECKALSSNGEDVLHISSETQLEVPAGATLFLHVVDCSVSTGKDPEARSLSTVVDRLRGLCRELPDALALLDERLAACGISRDDHYDQDFWRVGASRLFAVSEQFPAIRGSSCPQGVRRVRYEVALAACRSFRVTQDDVAEALKEVGGGKQH